MIKCNILSTKKMPKFIRLKTSLLRPESNCGCWFLIQGLCGYTCRDYMIHYSKQIVISYYNPDDMRKMLLLIMLISSLSVKAQTLLPMSFIGYHQPLTFSHSFDSGSDRKWSLHPYSGISAGYSFFNGGNTSILAVPVGLQLNRRLNNNLYAFAGVSGGPVYMNFNRSFLSANPYQAHQYNSLLSPGNLGIYSRAELGLMYVNDAKTFSLSGSISVERGSYPVLPYQQMQPIRNPQHRN